MDSKVCSVRFHLRRSKEEEEDTMDLSIKQVDLLNQVEISRVYHCDGLLLCVAKDNSRVVVWNPYLGQTRWIRPRTESNIGDSYALGYDINRNHKILRMVQTRNVSVYREIPTFLRMRIAAVVKLMKMAQMILMETVT